MVTEKDIAYVEYIQKIARMTDVMSLNSLIHEPDRLGDETELGDMIVADEPSLEELVDNNIRRERLLELIETLPPREQVIIKMRYGFEGLPMTLEEIGHCFSVTRERIRQLECKAMKMLRRKLYQENIHKFEDL